MSDGRSSTTTPSPPDQHHKVDTTQKKGGAAARPSMLGQQRNAARVSVDFLSRGQQQQQEQRGIQPGTLSCTGAIVQHGKEEVCEGQRSCNRSGDCKAEPTLGAGDNGVYVRFSPPQSRVLPISHHSKIMQQVYKGCQHRGS